jgi:hypothetical protein
MSSVHVYADLDDEVEGVPTQMPDEVAVRVGDVVLHLRTETAEQLCDELHRQLDAAQ